MNAILSEDILAHEATLPVQFDGIWRGAARVAPERELAIAVVWQAIADVKDCRGTRRLAARQRSAYQWLMSNDRSWEYSFLNICDAVGLPAASLRRALLAEDPANFRERAA